MSTDESLHMTSTDSAFTTLQVEALHQAAIGEWDQGRAERVGRTSTPCRRQSGNRTGYVAYACEPGLPQEVLRRTLQHIDENLDTKLTWDQLAAVVSMNAFQLGRHFKVSTGMTLHQYITRSRIRRAMTLLARAELGIADIALEVGFSCQSHLTTQFLRQTGTTPGAFRRAASRSPRRFDSVPTGGSLSPGRVAGIVERRAPSAMHTR